MVFQTGKESGNYCIAKHLRYRVGVHPEVVVCAISELVWRTHQHGSSTIFSGSEMLLWHIVTMVHSLEKINGLIWSSVIVEKSASIQSLIIFNKKIEMTSKA